MSPAQIVRRETKSGPRWIVRYRLGGREFNLIHAGSFRTLREARVRRDFVAGELAAGRDPLASLAAITETPIARTCTDWASAWLDALPNLRPGTISTYRAVLRRFTTKFGDRDPATLTPVELHEWLAALPLKPRSLRTLRTVVAMLLDYAKVDPNPARSRDVRLPRVERSEKQPPTAAHLTRILRAAPRWAVLPLLVMEQTAMRVGEVETLTWGDVDIDGHRLLIRAGKAKTGKARWAQTPDWLMDAIGNLCPVEDRSATRRVFTGAARKRVERALERACLTAGVPRYTPHDLRHRRLSLWHGQGVPARELADRAGHSKASMTLDVYSHFMPGDELDPTDLANLVMHP